MGSKLCSCELCFFENTETNLGYPNPQKNPIQTSPIKNSNPPNFSLTNFSNALKRNSSSSTAYQDLGLIDKKVQEITMKNQVNKILNCYKQHSSSKRKEANAYLSFEEDPLEHQAKSPDIIPSNNGGGIESASLPQGFNQEEESKKNEFLLGDECSFKGSVSDMRKEEKKSTESLKEENQRYASKSNKDNNRHCLNSKPKEEEKITNDDVMQLIGMFNGKDEDNNEPHQDKHNESDDNDNLSFE